MKENETTITDVARLAGLSKTIVSNYLNNKYGGMSDEARERIKRAIDELNYVPNKQYRNYKSTKRGTIGLIIPDIQDPFHTLICKGISDAAFKYNYEILFGNSDNNVVKENQYIESYLESADGIILSSVGNNDEKLAGLKTKKPIVLLDRSIHNSKYDWISSNNYESMQELMAYLMGNGYEIFGIFTEELIEGTARLKRYQSCQEFVEKHSKTAQTHYYTVNRYDEKILIKGLYDFMKQSEQGKGVLICLNGRTLMHVLSGIQTLLLKIPEDVGICGYDEFDAATLLHNGITTISQPTFEMAHACIHQLMKRIHAREVFVPEEIMLQSKLMIRGSV